MRDRVTFRAAALLIAGILPAACSNSGSNELSFGTPDEAVTALVSALENRDRDQLKRLLGPQTDTLLASGDAVMDSVAREAFLERYRAKHQLVSGGPDDMVLQVGEDDWPLPIPLVQENRQWHFDGEAGGKESVARRIGANELRTMDVMRGFVAAQKDYAAQSHDGVPKGTYAQVLRSVSGMHNGLYWDAAEGEPEIPAGPMLASAAAEGYTGGRGPDAPYHGYLFKMLRAQGPEAPGGAKDYVVNGRLTGGYALLAWPANYAASGVMSFLINQDGMTWQRDQGEWTRQIDDEMEN